MRLQFGRVRRAGVHLGPWRMPLWLLSVVGAGILVVAGQAVGPVLVGSVSGLAGLTVEQSIVVTAAEFRDYPPKVIYSISPRDDQLRVIDTNEVVQTTSTVTITLLGKTVQGGNGLAMHPVNGKIYALLKLQGQWGRQLVTLDPSTGVATSIGDTTDKFAGLAFHSNGVLYAISGDGAGGPPPLTVLPEALYTLDLATAAPTLVTVLGNGTDGETIAFNPDDGLIYHASGEGIPNINEVFETIDLATLAVSQITLKGQDYAEATALAYEGLRTFYMADLGRRLYRVNTDGVVAFLGTIDHDTHGLVPFDLAHVDDSVAVLNDEGTSFTAAIETHVGDSFMLILTLENNSGADANATLELDVPKGIDVELQATGAIKEAQLERRVWLLQVPSTLTESKVRIILETKDDHQPGFYKVTGRLVQVSG
ncbi:MAG: hypothetical protein HYY01_14620 [Chloroflexi bacterium]|nr:hypothetical protein [Chloroflexota bacterium]